MRAVVHEPSTGTRRAYSVSGPDTVDGYTKIPKSIGYMKGDIIVFRAEGVPQRLPAGTRGQILTCDPDAELGVKWVNP